MNLKGLVHRELGEGLTEAELASAVGVSERTIASIVLDKLPKDPKTWEKFGRYFRIDVDFLRTGGLPRPDGLFELIGNTHRSSVGPMRKVPLLSCHEIDQMVTRKSPPRVIRAQAMVETDVPGERTFAMKVTDNSMQPLFSEGEIIFVNPDLPSEPGHYVLVGSKGGRAEGAFLRQLKKMGGQSILHPLNRRYEDLPVTQQQRIWGRVVRLRKNL